MSEKRYTVGLQSKTIFDMKTELYLFDNKIICELLNAQNSLICEQQATIEQLRTQLLICQQSKNDDCRFKVWQVPPIRRGMRVSTTTIDDEQKKDSKRWRWSE